MTTADEVNAAQDVAHAPAQDIAHAPDAPLQHEQPQQHEQQQQQHAHAYGYAHVPITEMASLYVCDLLDEVTESVLFELFSPHGAIVSIRVCREPATRRPLGYAYVNFHNRPDAECAMKTLNGQEVLGQAVQIQWSLPSTLPPNTNLFIKNLDATTKPAELSALFAEHGTILSVKVGTNARGEGYGFVLFDGQEAAKAAMDAKDGSTFRGQKLSVAYHSKRERRRDGRVSPHSPNGAGHQANGYHNAHHQGGHFHGGAASQYLYDALASPAAHQQHHNVQHHHNEQTPFTNVYVKNLAANVDEQALRELFAPYGTITSCAVGVDENGRSRGFGFVNFDQCEAAMSAMQALNRVELDGKMLYVGRAQKKQERDEELRRRFESSVSLSEPSANGTDSPSPIGEHHGSAAYAPSNGFRPRRLVVNVYVRHIEDKVDEDHLFHAFAPFGNVLSTRVMRDENGISRGFGFVSYQTLDEARTAVQAMNEQMLFEGQKTPLYVALAQRKEQRMGGMLGGAMPTGGPMMKGLHRGGMHPMMPPMMPNGAMYPPPMFFPGPPPAGLANGPVSAGPAHLNTPAPMTMLFPGAGGPMSAPAYMPMPLPPSPPHHFNHAMMSMGMPLMDYGGVALNPVAADASPEVIVTEKHGMAPTSTTSAGGSQPDETTHVEMQGATAAAVVAVQE